MIRYLAHNKIDPHRWDACIAASVNRRVYAFSWYLDMVSPGWEALVEDDYTAVMPLTRKRKFGISYLAQPFFAQQLGVFSPDPLQAVNAEPFIRMIPNRFRLVEISLNSMNTTASGAAITDRRNHELDLNAPYPGLFAAYSTNARRNIKKAENSGIEKSGTVAVEALIALFRENFGKEEGILEESHYRVLQQLLEFSTHQGVGFTRGITGADGNLSSGAFFLFDARRVYMLLAASAPVARHSGSTFFLLDRFIREFAGQDLILDFEGGNDPDLGRFYKGFGARETTYPVIRIERLPKAARLGHNLIRSFRG